MLHAFEEKIHPRFPFALLADAVEEFVINGAVFLEIQGEVKQRLGEEAAVV
jgi:hypothetical protein